MSTQSEKQLEEKLLRQLVSQGYERVEISDEVSLLSNLKRQLEKLNNTSFSESEFTRIHNHLSKGTIFDKAKTLREVYALTRDDGTVDYIRFLDVENWCQNLFQVTNQVEQEGSYRNIYDVTILINGLPLVHTELKRRGVALREAFNQIRRYQKHSFGFNSALYQYVQIFVISNGVNTKYYANTKRFDYKQTFCWSSKDNVNINELETFTEIFLDKCHVSKMIARYIVLNETEKEIRVLRPYQYYAVEAIVDLVKQSNKNGYIWHTTGSGKTLTSFKAAQILSSMSDVYKVVFVVDRKDLDYQTTREFNAFSDGSVDGTHNTKNLINQFLGYYKNDKGVLKDTNLIITTIQKLNAAITKKNNIAQMNAVKDKRIVFIFDECHRSQFGDTHKRITSFFTFSQFIGFTGTPIFEQNAYSAKGVKKTTADLFGDILHKYVITDAIRDENVLRFSVEYVGNYHSKNDSSRDVKVEGIDIKELLESDSTIDKIVDFIIDNHDRKTHSKEFNSILCVSSIKTLSKYYESFKSKSHNLKIATIFSYGANEDFDDQEILEDGTPVVDEHSRDKLERYIDDYNKMFKTSYSTKTPESFQGYYQEVARRVREVDIDILIVVNMFLTGFDSPKLNTLYVDKNLQFHGLVQAFSRTNRLFGQKKSHGNIVCFRNLKSSTDEAIALFSNKDAKNIILLKPYDEYLSEAVSQITRLRMIAPTPVDVDELISESDKVEFIESFRDVLRTYNTLSGFSNFSWDEISIDEQEFNDFRSKYLDLYDSIKSQNLFGDKDKTSILNDLDFEVDLLRRDDITIDYIIELIAIYFSKDKSERNESELESVVKQLGTDPSLRSKKELINDFIEASKAGLVNGSSMIEYPAFVDSRKEQDMKKMAKEEELNEDRLVSLISQYEYDYKEPTKDSVVGLLNAKPSILKRDSIYQKLLSRLSSFFDTYIY